MKTIRSSLLPPNSFDTTDTRRDEEYVDAGFDDLYDPDTIADYGGRAGRLAEEDGAW